MTTHGPHWSNRAGNPSLEEPHWWAYIKTPPFITAPMLLSPQSPVPLSLWDKGFYLSHTKSIKKKTLYSLCFCQGRIHKVWVYFHILVPPHLWWVHAVLDKVNASRAGFVYVCLLKIQFVPVYVAWSLLGCPHPWNLRRKGKNDVTDTATVFFPVSS